MESSGVLVLMVVLAMSSPIHAQTLSGDGLGGGGLLGADLGDGFSLLDLASIPPGIINKDIDSLLERFQGFIPSRVELGSFDQRFARDCYLTGLDNGIARHGNASLEIPDTKAIYTIGLTAKKLTVHCTWLKHLGFFKLRGSVRAHTNVVSVRSKLTVEIAPGAHPMLEEFKVTNFGWIRTDVSGIGIFKWIGERVLDKIANNARDTIIRGLEDNVTQRLQSLLELFKLPSL